MQTTLANSYRNTPEGDVVERILRSCVHCGFCLATCPTYQVLGNELDSPRGRIYLMKQVFEGATPTAKTQLHLDRCLTCRNCETTCPSGVEYGKLLDIGRHIVEERVGRDRAAHGAEDRPRHAPAVQQRAEARPGRARPAAGFPESRHSGSRARGHVARTAPHPSDAGIAGLRAARTQAQ